MLVKMSNQEKTKQKLRIAIAKDVIASLNVLKVEQGVYIHPNQELLVNGHIVLNKQIVGMVKQECEVCAIGSLFLSLAQCNGQVVIENTGWDSISELDLFAELDKVFIHDQLKLIEYAFELGEHGAMADDIDCNGHDEPPLYTAAKKFGKKYKNPKNRLKFIMQNIINNKGEFKP